MNANSNRVLLGMAAALLVPFIKQKLGVDLTPEQAAGLVALAVAVFHSGAALWAKVCAAFMLYFPPKVTQQVFQQAAQPPGAKQ